MPTDNSLRADDRDGICDTGEEPANPDEHSPIAAKQMWSGRSLPLQNVQLMAKDNDLGLQAFTRLKAAPNVTGKKVKEPWHRV